MKPRSTWPKVGREKSRRKVMGMVGITFLWVDGYGDFPPNHPSHWTIWVLKFMVTCQLVDPPFQEANWHGVNWESGRRSGDRWWTYVGIDDQKLEYKMLLYLDISLCVCVYLAGHSTWVKLAVKNPGSMGEQAAGRPGDFLVHGEFYGLWWLTMVVNSHP